MKIGPVEKPCIVMAELGLNHNGNLETALQLVKAARDAGCHAIKVQAYTAEEFCGGEETYTYKLMKPSWTREVTNIPLGRHLGEEMYLTRWTSVTERQVDMFRRCQLSESSLLQVLATARNLGMAVVATATDENWISLLAGFGVDAFKVGSDDIVHEPLLELLAASGIPVIVSTGMAERYEILGAAKALGSSLHALLHCVSLYPTPIDQVNLGRMDALRDLGLGVPVGFSDHTENSVSAGVAIARGAAIIEKHLTMDKSGIGPDHWFSATPQDIKIICQLASEYPRTFGTGEIIPGPGERAMAQVARRSIVAAHDMVSGELVMGNQDIAYRRPGTGLPPFMRSAVIGMVTTRDIREGEQLTTENLMNPPIGKAN